jgi:hypothetical protein
MQKAKGTALGDAWSTPAVWRRSEEFCIGPVVDHVFWSDGCAEMGLSCGPCKFLLFPISLYPSDFGVV